MNEDKFYLNENESCAFYLFLGQYFSEIEKNINSLIQYKFKLIDIVLRAHFGIKATMFGLKKRDKYKLDNQDEIQSNLYHLEEEVKSNLTQSAIFKEIYINLAKHLNYQEPRFLFNGEINDQEERNWKHLKENFSAFGINNSVDEYKRLIKVYY